MCTYECFHVEVSAYTYTHSLWSRWQLRTYGSFLCMYTCICTFSHTCIRTFHEICTYHHTSSKHVRMYAWMFSCRRQWILMYGVATISRLLKIMVSFTEYCLFYRALLQKRPIFLRSLRIVATPYPQSLIALTRAYICVFTRHYIWERWGAGVEYHFQEISWNLRPVVNGT